MRKLTSREKYGLILSSLVLLAALGYRFGSPFVKKWQSFEKEIKISHQELKKVDLLMALEPSIAATEGELRTKSGLPNISKGDEIRSIIIKNLDETARKSGIQTIDQLNAKSNPNKKREKMFSAVKEAFIDQLYAYEVKSEMSTTQTDKEAKSKRIFPPLPTLPKELKAGLEKIISERGGLNRTDIAELVAKYKGQETDSGKQLKENSAESVSKIEAYQRSVLKKKSELRKLLSEVDTSYERQSFLITISFKSEVEPLIKFIYNLENSSKWFRVEAIKIAVADPKRALLSTELSLMATIL